MSEGTLTPRLEGGGRGDRWWSCCCGEGADTPLLQVSLLGHPFWGRNWRSFFAAGGRVTAGDGAALQ